MVAKGALVAANCEPVNAERRRGHRAAELQIVRNLGDVEEDFLQVSRHGDLFNRISKLSARDPQAGGAAGIIAGYQVRAVAEELCDVETFLDFRDKFFRRSGSWLQEVVAGPYARR